MAFHDGNRGIHCTRASIEKSTEPDSNVFPLAEESIDDNQHPQSLKVYAVSISIVSTSGLGYKAIRTEPFDPVVTSL